MKKKDFIQGAKDGLPIMLGYLAVSFSLGIMVVSGGLSVFQGALMSLTNVTSAGEFAGFEVIAAGASYLEMAMMMLVINARYVLMSCSLSQKLDPDLPLFHRLLIGWGVTDEIFGVSVCVPDKLNPWYNYGMMAISIPAWTLGTFIGVAVGNVLPALVVNALSVGIYGMFLAIIMPEGKKNHVVLGAIIVSFALSLLAAKLLPQLSDGMRILLLTILISAGAAILFPREEPDAAEEAAARTSKKEARTV